MKKQLSLIMAGGLLAFASCNSGTTPESGASQATIDSTVNARVEAIRIEMEAKNDSIINALAQWKADSIIAAMKGQAPKAAKPVAKAKHGSTAPSPVTSGANTGGNVVAQPSGPVNTGKMTGNEGVNTGKKGDQSEGVNTGKKH